jgi:hypothetical protein
MMMVTGLASVMQASVAGMDRYDGTAITKLWNSVCDYVDSNAGVTCSWSGMSSSVPPVPETIPVLEAKVLTTAGRVLDISGINELTTCQAVLGKLSSAMNTAVNNWKLILPASMFFITAVPGNLTPNSSTINLLPSMATDTNTAFQAISTNIISGLLTAMFMTPAAGTHSGMFTGTAFQTGPGIH